MSGEDEKAIQGIFVDQLGAKYPLVRIDKKDVEGYGIKFYPSVYVIDPNGNVHSVPDDRMPSDSQIEDLLKTATLAPKMPADSRYDPLRSMWKKSDFAKLRDYLDKMLAQPNLDAAMRDVFTAQKLTLTKKADGQVARVEKLGAGPEYVAAEDQLKRIVKDWPTFPAAEAARKMLERFAVDVAIKKEMAAERALQKMLGGYDTSKPKDVKKLLPELEKFTKKNTGTHAAKQAEEMRARLVG